MCHNSRKVMNETSNLHGYHISTIPTTGRNLNKFFPCQIIQSMTTINFKIYGCHALDDLTWNDPSPKKQNSRQS